MTISPSPSIPKFLACSPFSRMSMGNVTVHTEKGGREGGVKMDDDMWL